MWSAVKKLTLVLSKSYPPAPAFLFNFREILHFIFANPSKYRPYLNMLKIHMKTACIFYIFLPFFC